MRQPEVPPPLSSPWSAWMATAVLLEILLLHGEGNPVNREWHNRRAELDGEFQRRVVASANPEPRTAEEIEAEYIFGNRCDCHFWEKWRCHLVAGRATRRHVSD